MYFLKYWLQKTWLDKCRKSRNSEDTEKDNMANGLRDCCNQNGSIFLGNPGPKNMVR